VFAEGVLFLKKKIVSLLVENFRAYYIKIIEVSDSPKRIARGAALGLAFDFLPIPVISIPLSYVVARLTRCNPVAAVGTVVFFKLAVPFFYTLNVIAGNVLLGDLPRPEITLSGASLPDFFLAKLVEHGYPFLVGSLVNAALAWLAVYTLLIHLLERRHNHRGV